MVTKPKAKREKPKAENNKRRKFSRVEDAEFFKAVVEHSHDAILFLDSERKIFYASPSITQISGYEPEELIGKSGIEFNHPADREATTQKFLDLLQNPGKSISIENRLKHKNGSWFWVDSIATNFLDHPHVQAVVMNMRGITERKQAEEALQESEERQRQIIENTDAGYFYIDQEGCFQKVNPAWLRMHKYESAEEIIGQHFSLTQVGADMSSARQKVEQLLNGQKIIAGEFSRKCKDGSVGYHTFSARAVTKAGEIVGLEGFLIDITERKQAEQALQESEALYRQAIEVAGAVPYYESYYDESRKVKYDFIGEGIRQITGYGPEEFTAALWDSLILDIHLIDELAGYSLDEAIYRVRSGESPIWKCEHRIRRRNGEIRWVFEAAVEQRDENGVSYGSIGMYQDITARKLAEVALRESQQRLSLFFNQSLDGFFFSMIDEPIQWNAASDKEKLLDYVISHQHITEANNAMIEQYGSAREKLIGRTASDFFAHDLEQARRFRRNLFDSGHLHLETEERKDDGTPIWIEGDYVCMVDDQNRITGMFGIQRDVTSRKQVEEVLQEAEIKYRNLVERLPQVIYTSELGNHGVWSYVSPQIEKLLGFTPQEWLDNPGLWYQHVHPDDRDIQLALEEQAYARNEPFESEYRILTHAGNWIWIRDSGHIVPPQGYGFPIVQGMLTDITERKQADEALRKNKQRLQVFFNQSLDGFFFCDFEEPVQWKNAPNQEVALEYIISTKRFTDVNDAMLKQYGISREKFLSLTTNDVFAHDLEQGRKLRRQLFDNGYLRLETYERTDAGAPIWFEGDYVCIYTAEGSLTGFFGIQRDITDRKHAEIELRDAEEKYRSIFENAVDGIYQSSPRGYFLTVNPAFARMLGFESPQEAIRLITDIASQIYGESSRRTDFMLLLNEYGSVSEFEYQLRRKDNKLIWVSENAHAVRDDEGNIIYYEGIVEDITKRKQAEAELSLSKSQLLANLDNTPNVAVQWYDKDGHILYWNPASESMYGWKSVEVLGKTLEQLIHTPEEQLEFLRILAEVQETGKPYGPYEARVRRKDDTSGWVLATTFGLPMPDGQLGFVCMDVDITERKQAEELIQKQLRRLNALHTIDMAINSSANIQITLEVLLSQTLSQLNIDAADVLLFNQPAQTLELTASRGFRSNINLQAQQRLGDGFAGQVINERRTIHISNLMEAGKNLRQMHLLAHDSFTEYFGVPLIAKGQIKGVLEIYHRSPLNPPDDWLNFLEVLAGQTAIAIDNSQLVNGLQRSNMELVLAYDATIEGWSRAMDLRDKETEGHTQRVTTLTLKLARAMGIREADIIQIQRGGLLHDIGKLGVPDGILFKPGKLIEAEWEIMRQHPTYAFKMLAPVTYLKRALDIPYCHHEKWDGTGYPRGLQGEQIPLAARIFAVVDVWDALTSDRPYRPAWTKERTFEHIRSLSGTHFDPKVVDAFFELHDRGWQ